MKRIQLLPNVVTAFGLTCGLFVIFRTNMLDIDCRSHEVLQISVLILMLAGFADILDGALARATKAESAFGSLFDSLSDAISFGVAPSVLMLKNLGLESETKLSLLATFGALIYSVCGVLRLVRFNMNIPDPKKAPIEEVLASKKFFTGLPIPGAAGAAVSLNLFLISPLFTHYIPLSQDSHAYILTAAMFFLGYLMVSNWKFPSLKSLAFRLPSFQSVFITVVGAVSVFYGLIYHFSLMAVVLSWSFIFVSISLSLIQKAIGSRNRLLRSFAMNPDD